MESTQVRERVSPKETIKVKVVDTFKYKEKTFEVWKRETDFSSNSFNDFTRDK